MVSFSVNQGLSLDVKRIKATNELINQANKYNRDYLGEAYIQLMTGQASKVNLDYLARVKQSPQNENFDIDSLVTEDELEGGYKGVVDVADSANFTDAILWDVSKNYYVDRFLEYREYLYFKAGSDIWVMIRRIREGDKIVQSKLRNLLDEYNLTDFFKEFLSHIEYVYEVERILG